MKTKPRYRALKPGEIIQEGDEWLPASEHPMAGFFEALGVEAGTWHPVISTIGMKVVCGTYRRPIRPTKKKSAKKKV